MTVEVLKKAVFFGLQALKFYRTKERTQHEQNRQKSMPMRQLRKRIRDDDYVFPSGRTPRGISEGRKERARA
jgi:hypothetical protein